MRDTIAGTILHLTIYPYSDNIEPYRRYEEF